MVANPPVITAWSSDFVISARKGRIMIGASVYRKQTKFRQDFILLFRKSPDHFLINKSLNLSQIPQKNKSFFTDYIKIKTKQISHLSNEDVPSGTQGLGCRCTETDPHHPGNLTDDHLHGPHVIQD